jgi:hypothetical protein
MHRYRSFRLQVEIGTSLNRWILNETTLPLGCHNDVGQQAIREWHGYWWHANTVLHICFMFFFLESEEEKQQKFCN